jgi:putative ABC transport system permease protein
VLIASVALVFLVGAAVGAFPVLTIAGRDAASGLRDRAAGASPRVAGKVRRILAAAQFALAVALIHSAGLLIASATEVRRERLGFEPASTISMRVNIPVPTFRDRGAREALLRRLRDETEALPGVEAVGLVNALPLTPGRQDLAMAVEGRPFKADGTDPLADYRVASAGYFAAMGIRVVRGRVFTDDDATQTYTPLVISEALAKLLFPDGSDPLGHRLRFGPASPWMPIIGVVEDAKNRRLTETPRPELYTPGLGTWSSLAFRTEITIVARVQGDAMALAQPMQRMVASVAPDVATYEVVSLGDVVREAGSRMTTATRLMTGYAIAAFILAIAGVYAVLTYLISQRHRELAVRRALGASAPDILRLVAHESVRVVGVGAAAGAVGAVLSARLLSGLLFGVGSFDPAVISVVVGTAALAATVAAIVPALRAVRIDPIGSLRGDS